MNIEWAIPLLVALLVGAYGGASLVIASAVTRAKRRPLEGHPQHNGLEYEDAEFKSRRGDVSLRGWYIAPGEQGPVLILVHGIDANRASDGLLELATGLALRGFGILLFDLRGHGESGGSRVSGGYFERWDVLGAFDYLVGRGVAPGRIGVLGYSMGAAAALLAAAEEPAIGAVVVDSAYASVSELIAREVSLRTRLPRWVTPVLLPGATLMARLIHGVDVGALSLERLGRRLHCPILVIHGSEDSYVPPDHGVRVHRAAPRGSALWLAPDAGHVGGFLTYPDEYVERVTRYVAERLGVS